MSGPHPINLDANATTEPSPAVIRAVHDALAEFWHNPSSVHRAGQAARHRVELARQSLAELIGAKPRDLVLTSGGTESIDLAVRGALGARAPDGPRPVFVTSRVEHAAVRELAEHLERTGGASVRWADVGADGRVDPGSVAALLGGAPGVVCAQWANNETGAVQPVAEIHAACARAGAVFLCDGTQWVGKMPVDVSTLAPFDALVFSPHKFHGPKGVGCLWARRGVKVRPAIHGTQELGRRGGTENVPGILGAGVAAAEARAWVADAGARERLEGLRDRFERDVLRAVPDARVNGPTGPGARLWNTTNIAFPRLEAEALLMLLSERGVYASAGAACSSGSLDPSPVLLAMGVPPELAHGSLRFSLSRHTTEADLTAAAPIIADAVRTLRGSSASVV